MDDTVTVAFQLQGGAPLPCGQLPSSPILERCRRSPLDPYDVGDQSIINDPRSARAESFRSLRTASRWLRTPASFRRCLSPARSLVRASPTWPTTPHCLALAGKRCCCRCRYAQPSLHQLFDLPVPGLSDVLEGKVTAGQAIYPHRTVATLALLAAGLETTPLPNCSTPRPSIPCWLR